MSEAISQPPCPSCGKPTDPVYRPFCSKRCADVDLQRWLTARYVIPTEDEDDAGEEPHHAGQRSEG